MEFHDQKLPCADCGKDFVFTIGEQEFYQQRGFTNTPKRCADCRIKRKAQHGNGRGGQRSGPTKGRSGGSPSGERQKYPAVCTRCRTAFDAPFQPKEGRPVFCRECFETSKGGN